MVDAKGGFTIQWRRQNAEKFKEDYWIKQWFSSIATLFKKETSVKGKNLLPEFFPLRAVPYGMENHVYHIRWPSLNITIFITHVPNCLNAIYLYPIVK